MPFVEVTYSIAVASTCGVDLSSPRLVEVETSDTSTLDSESRIASTATTNSNGIDTGQRKHTVQGTALLPEPK